MLLTITQYRKLTDALVVRNLISKTIPVKIIYSCIDCSPAISAVIADVKNIAVCSYSGFHHCHADTVRIRLESPVYIFVADHRIPAYVWVVQLEHKIHIGLRSLGEYRQKKFFFHGCDQFSRDLCHSAVSGDKILQTADIAVPDHASSDDVKFIIVGGNKSIVQIKNYQFDIHW